MTHLFVLLISSFFLFSGPSAVADSASPLAPAYVGSSAVDMTPPIGVPLAGYGGMKRRLPYDLWGKHRYATYFKPSIGVHDPIRAKAFMIMNEERTVVFISMDVIGVDYAFYKVIKQYAKTLGIDDVFLSATHTHSGPGTLSRSWLYEIMAADLFQPSVYRLVEDSVKNAIDLAYQDLKPASLFKTTFQVPGIQSNRRHIPGHFDPNANLLYAQSASGKIEGGIVNYAVHPIAMGQKNLYFTADLAGGIERALKKTFETESEFLFVNGAEGDVSTAADGWDGIELHAGNFAEAAKAAYYSATPVKPVWKSRSMMVTLPKGKLALWACDEKVLGKIFGKMRLGGIGKKALPPVGEIKQLVLDDVLMMSWPGEATTDVGFSAKAAGTNSGYKETWNLGLTNGYMGYLVTSDEFHAGGYEVCVAYHGPKASQILLDAHQQLLDGDPL